jgi:osmotically-inducible protein OsmY
MVDPTRYRDDRDRDEDRPRRDEGSDGGFIARAGFGNARSGYGRDEQRGQGEDRGGGWGTPRREERSRDDGWGRDETRGRGHAGRGGFEDRDYGSGGGGRERDYGDSAGYGSGGSARDYREVVGRDFDERYRNPDDVFRGGRGGRPEHGRPDEGRGYGGRERGSEFRYSRGDYSGGGGYGGSGGRSGERGFLDRAGDEIASWFGSDEAERRRRQDAERGDQGAQHHRGRGPRNYQRSDERIRDDVNDRLTDDPHIDASDVEVSVANREVTLSGFVSSRFAKRHAEDIAESVSGVAHVQNNIRVRSEGSAGVTPGAGLDSRQGASGTGDLGATAFGTSRGGSGGTGEG